MREEEGIKDARGGASGRDLGGRMWGVRINSIRYQ
jgi:hypothetical protein